MALDSCYDCCVLPALGWDWEPRSLAAGDAAHEGIHDDDDDDDGNFFAAMLGVESPVSSSEASSGGGYLEDAIAHWSDRCKRQRMAPPPPLPRRPAPTVNEDLQCLLQMQSFWDSGSREGDLLHDSEMMVRETSSFVSEEDDDASGREQEQEEGPSAAGGEGSAAQGGGGGEEAGPPPRLLLSATGQLRAAAPGPLLQLQKATTGAPARRRSNYSDNELPSSSSCSSLAGKENAGKGVLYPFAFVKPLGLEGGGTAALKDVNRRILKRPARPVRHPVGQFACSPAVSTDGLGLSGKAVVSLTRIRTGGKGTITIIRTRG